MYALPNTRGGHTQHREKYKTTKKNNNDDNAKFGQDDSKGISVRAEFKYSFICTSEMQTYLVLMDDDSLNHLDWQNNALLLLRDEALSSEILTFLPGSSAIISPNSGIMYIITIWLTR